MAWVSIITRVSGLLLACAALLFSALLSAEAAPRLTLSPHHVPSAVTNLQAVGKLDRSKKLALAIGLPLRNAEALPLLLEELYDPASANYHRFLSPQQFIARFGPAPADYQAVADYMRARGLTVTKTFPDSTLLVVSGLVTNIEAALHVNLLLYPHPHEGRNFFAPDTEPALDLDVPVLNIAGLDNYLIPHPMSLHPSVSKPNAFTGSGPSGNYIGNDFRVAYLPGVNLTGAGQSVGLLEFDGYYANDITAYEDQAGLPHVTLTNVLLNGVNGSASTNNLEVALDIEMAASLAPGLSKIVVYEGTDPDTILTQMANDRQAMQLSASWTYPIDATTTNLFARLGAQGQSFFNASGDSGAYTSSRFNANVVASPSDVPYLTSVGGTSLTTTGAGGGYVSETVWNWFTTGEGTAASSGGISPTYFIPNWQTGISMTSNGGSTSARNLPDVAMTADNIYVTFDNGSSGEVGGTSAACPLWAAFTALVNQQSQLVGVANVGFLNPALYAIGKGANYTNDFHDVTTGANTNDFTTKKFFARTGYDLCTGWGSPQGAAMISALTQGSILITGQPTNLTAAPGNNATFSVSAVGNAVTYQWRFNGTNIGLATNSSYTITNAQPANQGAYAVLASNSVGTVLSSNATLSVHGPPVIASQPQSSSLVVGNTATFSVTATGSTPLVYQWSFNSNPLTDNGRVSGSQTTTLVITNLLMSDAGNYQVFVTNGYGSSLSAVATLTVAKATPTVTWVNPSAIPYGTVLTASQLNATANQPGHFVYTPSAGTLLSAGTSALSTVFTPTDTTDYNSATNAVSLIVSRAPLTVTASNASRLYGQANPIFNASIVGAVNGDNLTATATCSATSSSAPGSYPIVPSLNDPNHRLTNYSLTMVNGTLTVTPAAPPSISSIVPNTGTTNGSNTVMLIGSGFETGATVYFGSLAGSSVLVSNATNIIVTTPPAPAGAVNVALTNADGQVVVFTNGYTYVVPTQPPQITSQPTNQSLAPGQGASLAVSATGTAPLDFQWLFNQSSLGGATNSTLALPNVQSSNAGYYQVLVSNAYGAVTSSVFTLNVLGVPVSFVGGHGGAQYTNGQFILQLTGLTGQGQIVIQSSSNLVNWTPIYTNPPSFGQLQFIDTNAGKSSINFYRAVTPSPQ